MSRTAQLLLFVIAAAFGVLSATAWHRRPISPVRSEERPASSVALPQPVAWPGYVGVEACRECHDERVDSFVATSHYHSLAVATPETIRGDFEEGRNVLRTRHDDLRYEMTAGADGYRQASIEEFPESVRRQSRRIDMLMGSGKYIYAYMYWEGNRLYQMPVAYFTPLNAWVNAPGYSDRWAWWDRAIPPRCLECHATYFEHVPGSENAYADERFEASITCERCHGPGQEHVDFHRSHPDIFEAKHIVYPAALSRERQLDVCGQCHATVGTPLKPPFSYRPGEPLEEYLRINESDHASSAVHIVNQVQRLSQSACFRDESMTCTTCHDPHVRERGQTVLFSQRCQQCHATEQCGYFPALGPSIAANCIDCHMPLRDDQGLPFSGRRSDKQHLIEMREHLVGIYPAESARIADHWRQVVRVAEMTASDDAAAGDQAAGDALRRAELWLMLGEPQSAIELLTNEAERRPWDSRVTGRLGELLLSQGDVDKASRRIDEAHRAGPADPRWIANRALIAQRRGREREAVEAYCEVLRLDPDMNVARNNLAWMLATSPTEAIRDGAWAVDLMEPACRGEETWSANAWDTLAAGYAEAGRFDEAVAAARRALELARAAGQKEVEPKIRARLELFQQGLAYRAPAR